MRHDAAFTMVEIALSLGIIAFALVAIIGVLPSGMKVQRENREDTIVNQDAAYLLEAIRSGSRGVEELTNYVESITVRRGAVTTVYTNNRARPGGYVPLTNAQHIVALLSTPRVERLPNGSYRVNTVTAQMRSISGRALDQSAKMSDFAFRYQVTTEVNAFTNVPPELGSSLPPMQAMQSINLAQNLYEVRVTMRWPLFQRGSTWDVGRYRRTLRTLVSGELLPLYTNTPAETLYLLEPYTFLSAH
jgi:type II secretory pathway pseudopilin PulG